MGPGDGESLGSNPGFSFSEKHRRRIGTFFGECLIMGKLSGTSLRGCFFRVWAFSRQKTKAVTVLGFMMGKSFALGLGLSSVECLAKRL